MSTFKISLKIKIILPLFISSILILFVSLVNNPGNGIIVSQGDQYSIINSRYISENYVFQWLSFREFGVATISHVNLLFYNIFYVLLDNFNLQEKATLLWIFSFLSLSFTSSLFACKIIVKDISIENAILCALFYTFNQSTFNHLSTGWGFSPYIYFYIFFPLTFALFIKALFTDRIFYSVLAGVSSVLLLPSFMHPAFFYEFLFVTFLFILIFFTTKCAKITKLAVVNIFAFYSIAIMVSLFWIFPSVNSIAGNQGIQSAKESLIDWISWQVVPFIQSFRLIFIKDWNLYPYYFQYGYILKFLILILSFFPIVLLGLYLLQRKKNRLVLSTILFLLIYLFLMKKVYPPFGFLNMLSFKYIPFIYLLRSTDKWMMPLTFFLAFILGHVLNHLSKEKKFKQFSAIIFSIIIVYSLPFWSGQLIKGGYFETQRFDYTVKVPQYYYQMANYVNGLEEENYKVMSEPYVDTPWVSYNWRHEDTHKTYRFIGEDPTALLFDKPPINPKTRISGFAFNKKISFEEFKSCQWYYRLYSLLNVKYVLFHDDAPKIEAERFEKNMLAGTSKNMKLKKEFNSLRFYELNADFVRPLIYCSE
ncbi:MAG: hypothetical protein E3K37_16675 [Candidatus Kuenenia sp.]|nr:hypothetical protein [Candidatus Kuenenia hertensis]